MGANKRSIMVTALVSGLMSFTSFVSFKYHSKCTRTCPSFLPEIAVIFGKHLNQGARAESMLLYRTRTRGYEESISHTAASNSASVLSTGTCEHIKHSRAQISTTPVHHKSFNQSNINHPSWFSAARRDLKMSIMCLQTHRRVQQQ